jgi:hypothetical protein
VPSPEIETHFHNITERLLGFEEWCEKNKQILLKRVAINKLMKKYEKHI